MNKNKTILVTGCGGDIGTSVGRILKESFLNYKIIGADITLDSAGKFIFDFIELLPRADSANYFSSLSKLISNHLIDLIIPISEAEIRLFFKNNYCDYFENIPVIMPNSKTFEYSHDKFKTPLLLSQLKLPNPWTLLVNEEPLTLPCVIKNRGLNGKGGIELVNSDSIAYFRQTRPNDLWQEYLQGDEYTCGLYGTCTGEFRSIIFKRKLFKGNSGFTVSGEVIENNDIHLLLNSLATGLELRGSCNIQLRLTPKGPMIFEINPRFSSTVMFRHKLGFKDVIWSCYEAFGMKPAIYIAPTLGIRFYKGFTEYLDYPS